MPPRTARRRLRRAAGLSPIRLDPNRPRPRGAEVTARPGPLHHRSTIREAILLKSFGSGYRAAVIGASGGIGGAFAAALRDDPACADVACFSRSGRAPAGMKAAALDITEEAEVAAAAAACGPVRLVIVATGLLHDGAFLPEKDMRALDRDRLARSFLVNAVGPALVAKHFLPLLPRRERGALAVLSARVGSIADNMVGGWHGYRASKAALNMLLRTIAIETARRNPAHVILALQPGTVDTGLSRPFQAAAKALMTPRESVSALLQVIDGADADLSGALLDWRGERLAY
jgi:NAD(P)-dependent dehydrogenase (short-subunit alcohol dehydrogenase family)